MRRSYIFPFMPLACWDGTKFVEQLCKYTPSLPSFCLSQQRKTQVSSISRDEWISGQGFPSLARLYVVVGFEDFS